MSHTYKESRPSSSLEPDLDWSQVRETVRMLNLAVAQIDISLCEGDDSVQTLSESFTLMFESINKIKQGSKSISEDKKMDIVLNMIEIEGNLVSSKIETSIVAFQFYDKLSQRLTHVRHALEDLADLVDDRARLYNPAEWKALQMKIRGRYSMQEEQDMFDMLLAGASINDALTKGLAAIKGSREKDIELF